ncbi:MAG: helix-turn-helix transcriptional regulator [Patescibacteria group bacterium]
MNFSREMLKGAAEVIVLHALQEMKTSYGYQLLRSIREESKGIFDFQEGTLYPLLYRLEERGLVTSKEQEMPSGKTRRYYRLTSQGRRSYEHRRTEYVLFFQGMRKILGFSL